MAETLRDDQRIVVLHSKALTPVSWHDYVELNRSGIKRTSDSHLTEDPFFKNFEGKVVADTDYDPKTDEVTNEYFRPGIRKKDLHRSALMMWRTALLGLDDLSLLDKESAQITNQIDRRRVGLVVGSTFSGSDHLSSVNIDRVVPSDPMISLLARIATAPAMQLDIRGPVMQIGTECASGATAADIGIRYLTSYREDINPAADLMIVGGADSPISVINTATFLRGLPGAATTAEDPEQASKPLDKSADGLVIGEGAAVLFLATWAGAKRLGFNKGDVKAELVAHSSSTHAETKVLAGHEGTVDLIEAGLRMAKVQPHEISHVNLHGTGTGEDGREVGAWGEAIDNHGLRRENYWLVSTKCTTGHTMGASGAVEAHYATEALVENTIPPALKLRDPIDETEGFSLGSPEGKIVLPNIDVVFSTSLGFGGTGTILGFRKFKP
ncbi:MAG TPA: beta-ketoacyl synthase N-terminal-like domain-containing protein [Candidatus Saccharimonadales bacterium]|nr:beta-ketoacyl synthase N-terminal-like domain-containing protein [Candidatus Saccharimonadales bacterium]